MEDQQLERKFRELGQGIQELKNNATTDMQLLKMMLGCSLGLQLVIFLVLIFGENLTHWLGLTLNFLKRLFWELLLDVEKTSLFGFADDLQLGIVFHPGPCHVISPFSREA